MVYKGVVIQDIDVIDTIDAIHTKNKRFQAILLSDLEDVLDRNSPKFRIIRKLFLDAFNNYTRSTLRAIFGDIEYPSRYRKINKQINKD